MNLTRDDILFCTDTRQLDAWCAEHIYKWKGVRRVMHPPVGMVIGINPDTGRSEDIPNYCTWQPAMETLKLLSEMGSVISVLYNDGMWRVIGVSVNGIRINEFDEHGPSAVIRAVLLSTLKPKGE